MTQHLYRKHNSFQGLEARNAATLEETLERLRPLLNDPSRRSSLSPAHSRLLEKALHDLFEPAGDESAPRLGLSASVREEIRTLLDEELARYLVHRYRYEIFPQTKELDDYPPYLQIEPTSFCNFRCVFCYQSDKSFSNKSEGYMGHMTVDLFKRVVDEAAGNVEFLSLASRGEPTLCPGFEEMLAYTRGKFLNLKLNTNASLLTERLCRSILESGVRTVVFSADAAEEEMYGRLRVGGSLKKTLDNVRLFAKLRAEYPGRPLITRVSGVKVAEEQDLSEMKDLWGGLVDQVAFTNPVDWVNVYESSEKNIETPCSDLWRRMFVWYDGLVNPCDVDYKSTLTPGRFGEKTLHELWRSEGYERLRTEHLSSGRKDREPCRRCTVI